MNPFGLYLSTLRHRKRMKQKAVAEAMGLSPSYICEIENGRRNPPSAQVIDSIAEVMSLSPGELRTLHEYAEQSVKVFHMPEDLPMEGYSCMHQMRRALRTLSSEQFSALESMIVALSTKGDKTRCNRRA